nr:hypothetical protein [Eubacterium sp.]
MNEDIFTESSIKKIKRGKRKMRKNKVIKGLLALSAGLGAVMACFGFLGNTRMSAFSDQVSEEKKYVPQAKVVEEEVSKRSKFTKGFIMSDGSHLGAIYSMPVNYKKNGVWKEVDTNLKKKGKYYQTKQTDLSIKLSKYSGNKKETVKLNRGKYKVSFFMVSNKKTSAKVFNKKKKEATDVINE